MKRNSIYNFLIVVLIAGSGVVLYFKFFHVKDLKKLESLYNEAQIKLVNESILYPDSLIPINIELNFTDFKSNLSNETYLVTIIDADCSICVDELTNWKKYLQENNDYPVLFLLMGSNRAVVEYLVKDELEFTHPVFLDQNELFEQKNFLAQRKSFRTYYVKNDIIQKVGSPILLKGLIE